MKRVVSVFLVAALRFGMFANTLVVLAIAALCCGTASAQQRAADPAALQAKLVAAIDAAKATAQRGPVDVPLKNQATLHVPPSHVFIPTKEAAGVLQAMGNRTADELAGMLFPGSDADPDAFIVLQYISSGYINDDDAKDWNPDELLDSIRTGTAEGNKERVKLGVPEIEVLGWAERPLYDSKSHQLRWAISSKGKGVMDANNRGVNYNTYTLGREGYISMNLVTELAALDAQKPMIASLLAGLNFIEGKTYADFNSGTDKVAEYGLVALIGGIAAKKLGLIALAGVFFAKFAKVIALGAIAVGAGAFKMFRRKKTAPAGVAMPSARQLPPDDGKTG